MTQPELRRIKPDEILRESLGYWQRTLGYQLLFSLLYFSVFFLVWYLAASKFGVLEEMMRLYTLKDITVMQQEVQRLAAMPEYQNLSLTMVFTTAFLYPLNAGLQYIFRKLDEGEQPTVQDLFAGYSGVEFFKYLSYFLIWIFVYQLGMLLVVPALLWVVATVLVTPLLAFRNVRFMEALRINIKVLGQYPLLLVLGSIFAVVVKFSGLLFCGVGMLVTFPFWNVVIYVLYKKLLAGDEKTSV